jgi:phosphinothricin acetyltransferase
MDLHVRPADADDLERINDIYNAYIVDSHTSFDIEPWTLAERRRWYAKYERDEPRLQLLVLEVDTMVVGFASSSPFRDKKAYDTSVETTIVLDENATGRGWGGPLMKALLERLAAAGVHRAYALIALPNELSVRLHERLGYTSLGTMDEVGHKLDQFHSVHIMERRF